MTLFMEFIEFTISNQTMIKLYESFYSLFSNFQSSILTNFLLLSSLYSSFLSHSSSLIINFHLLMDIHFYLICLSLYWQYFEMSFTPYLLVLIFYEDEKHYYLLFLLKNLGFLWVSDNFNLSKVKILKHCFISVLNHSFEIQKKKLNSYQNFY